MLEVGVNRSTTLTIEEEKTHFALWAVMKAPLIIGADLRTIRKESLDILMNKELIAVNQDPNSYQAVCPWKLGCIGQVKSVATTMTDGSKVVVITNWYDKWSSRFYFLTPRMLGLKFEKG